MKVKRCNPRLDVDPVKLGRVFSLSNLSHDEQKTAEVILSAIEAGDFRLCKKLCDEFVRPEFGADPACYFRRKQFTALLTKVPFAGNNAMRLQTAKDTFFAAERRCKRSNRRLSWFFSRPDRMSQDMRVLLSRARNEVHRIFGALTDSKLQSIRNMARPGSGVSIGTHNRFRVSLPYKLADTDLVCTPSALPYARGLVESSPGWLRLVAKIDWEAGEYWVPYVVTDASYVSFVPKDARTLRTIAVEPALNVWLQLGVHSYLAKRLDQMGNDITNQERNQMLARDGSLRCLSEGLVTIDLSDASDSISVELVRYLVPSGWFSLLDDFRCKSTTIGGSTIQLEKFSSMGNGFTFALETVIFLSLVRAANSLAGCTVASVYGDDIICETGAALLLTEALRWCGFKVNSEKSYYIGPFRESCGADWHTGTNVTPQYVRKSVLRCTDVYHLLNRLHPTHNTAPVRDYLLAEHRKKEPVLLGLENEDTTSCLFVPWDYLKGLHGQLRWHSSWQTWRYRVWEFIPESERVAPDVGLVSSLKGRGRAHEFQLRGRGTFRLGWRTPGVTRGLYRN